MYEQYFTSTGSIGSAAEVWIDKEKKLCKKFFKPDSITITNKLPIFTEYAKVKELFDNEIYWSTKLKSKFVLETYEYGELEDNKGFYLIQEYAGPDLLSYKNIQETFPDVKEQLIEMFHLFKEHNVYKKNNARCNLTGNNNQIKAFDFKWAVPRSPEHKKFEVNSINTWLSKIDHTLPEELLCLV
jgi:hypothetical protein|tara:strand:- start:91 stop:645 length:555 start_codon:yes stop_codon:yes gene_type:complete